MRMAEIFLFQQKIYLVVRAITAAWQVRVLQLFSLFSHDERQPDNANGIVWAVVVLY